MVTYKERKANTRVYVLRKNNDVIGVYGNLKKLCELPGFPDLPSYHTLSRLDRDTEYPHEKGQYKIDFVKLY